MRNKERPTTTTTKKVDNKIMAEDFKKYEDNSTKKIKPDSFEKMGTTLGVDIYQDIFIMYFLYKCQCKTYGEITLEEYTKGLTSFAANTLADLKPSIIKVKEDLLNITTEDFKNFYQFLFTFSWDKRANPSGLPLDIAGLYFEQLFGNQFKIIPEFMEFLEKNKKANGITKDQWFCFLELLKVFSDQFPKGYNVEESWPTLFDEFYEWYCTKYGIKIEKPEYF